VQGVRKVKVIIVPHGVNVGMKGVLGYPQRRIAFISEATPLLVI
jgi:hypothetical protein